MQVGNLVKFVSPSEFLFPSSDYRNPGIIVKTDDLKEHARYKVVWADQKVTVEYDSYLEVISASR